MNEEVIFHYNSLVDENNDPVRDPLSLQYYMDKWDGQSFIENLGITPDKSILEIGVGTGRLAIKVCSKSRKFTGIDFSDKSILRAKENLDSFRNIRLICSDFMSYSFDELFDIIYSSLTFMHIVDKASAIHKIADLLTDKGRLVLSIEKSESEIIDYGCRKIRTFPDNADNIKRLLEMEGLNISKQYETELATIFVCDK